MSGKSKGEKINNIIINTLIAICMIAIVLLIFTNDRSVHQFVMEQFSNTRAEVISKEVILNQNVMKIYDHDRNNEITVINSKYYDRYSVGDVIPMNNRTLIHTNGIEEEVYYFLDDYAH